MRVLVTIPHYFATDRAAANPRHGSLGPDSEPRRQALTACLTALRHLFVRPQCMIDLRGRTTHPTNRALTCSLDIVLCTTSGRHLIDDLPVPSDRFEHHATQAAPPLLGFECHDVLRQRLGHYDYYCYLEDDLILHDPWLFAKLAWFSHSVGDDKLLQPQRYEVGEHPLVHKAYLDGDMAPRVTAPFQDMDDTPRVTGIALNVPIVFRRTLNPHSGCFFLNAAQMSQWARQTYFLDRDCRFIGPLESAATLGIMRTFKIYKADLDWASFLEIEHRGTAFLGLISSPSPPPSDAG